MTELSFEKAFERLEAILEKMNNQKVSLDESLQLFEEADKLISQCNGRLVSAEQKIETLIKNRNNQLVVDENQQPLRKPLEEKDNHLFEREQEQPF